MLRLLVHTRLENGRFAAPDARAPPAGCKGGSDERGVDSFRAADLTPCRGSRFGSSGRPSGASHRALRSRMRRGVDTRRGAVRMNREKVPGRMFSERSAAPTEVA